MADDPPDPKALPPPGQPEPSARTACVIAGSTPEQVAAVGKNERVTLRANRLGTLVVGRPGDLVIDYAAELPGPVYDVMYSTKTGWFSVTIFRGLGNTKRWDNRPGTNPGYPRADDVLGATTPLAILEAIDMPASAVGYVPA
ncbi:MAG: hypothetical protein JWO36_1165 [Myxococcales bacterium]|nr:hypothetical protein [Myxococcales bacterium]